MMAFVPPPTTTSLVVTDVAVMQLTDFKRFMAHAVETSVVVVSVEKTKTTAPASVCPRDDADANKNATSEDAPVQTAGDALWSGACTGMAIVGTAVTASLVIAVIVGVTGFGSE